MAQAKQASSSGVMLLVMRWSMQAMATPKPMIPAPPSRISRRMRHSLGGWRRSHSASRPMPPKSRAMAPWAYMISWRQS
ncbi:Uncharacterised protein [Klebsiella pneumoniae]|nr:Uncharacterised protein [Klebsiella pneumoniae]